MHPNEGLGLGLAQMKKDGGAVAAKAKESAAKVKKEVAGSSRGKKEAEQVKEPSGKSKKKETSTKESVKKETKEVTVSDAANGKSVVVKQAAKKEEVEKEVKDGDKKAVTKTTRKRTTTEKKTYDLPGQKYDVPEERDPLRIFYETTREQVPNSEMAETWLMEHGLLPEEEAKAAFEKRQKQKGKPATPIKSSAKTKASPSNTKANGSGTSKKTAPKTKPKRERDDDASDEDDDFVAKPKKRLKT